MTLETGTPFTATAPDNSQTGRNHAARANCVGDPYAGATTDPSQFVGPGAPGFFLNPAAFAIPALGTFGNCAPRAFHGPGLQNVDLSLFKDFPVTERFRVQFRAEFFNAFNHANFNNPNASVSPSSIGVVRAVFQYGYRSPRDPVRLEALLLKRPLPGSFMKLFSMLFLAASAAAQTPYATSISPGAGAQEIPINQGIGGAVAKPEETAHARQPDHDHRPSG